MEYRIKRDWYPGKITIDYDKLHVPEIFGRVSFPHRDPGTLTYLARDKDYVFTITSGYKYIESEHSMEKHGIPFGIFPRLILMFITTHAKYKKSRKIVISDNLTEFLRFLGYSATGGERGTISQLQNQVERLLNCRICIRWINKNRRSQKYLSLVDKINLWESQDQENPNSNPKVEAVLSESFYKWIQQTAFPVKPSTVEALRRSLLACDLYLFLTSRSYRLKNRSAYISWSSLESQLGVDYKETAEFTRHAKKAINNIQNWYPELKIRYERGRLVLLSTSKPDIR